MVQWLGLLPQNLKTFLIVFDYSKLDAGVNTWQRDDTNAGHRAICSVIKSELLADSAKNQKGKNKISQKRLESRGRHKLTIYYTIQMYIGG